MKNKIVGILICVMLVLTAVVFIPDHMNVEATPGSGGDRENDVFSLDLDYIWNITKNLSYVIYDAYEPGEIPKGRAFGSKGGIYTVNQILIPKMNALGLEDVYPEQIKHIENVSKNYTSIVNVNDIKLTINNDDYPFNNTIPIEEFFLIPAGRNQTTASLSASLTINNTFENVEILPENMTKFDPFGETFFEKTLNITIYQDLNNYGPFIIGKLKYISENGEIPDADNQIGTVYLLDDLPGVQDKLDNLTNAMGSIIVDSDSVGIGYVNASKCDLFPVVSISSFNGTTVKNILENHSDALVENITGSLIISYDICNDSGIPFTDFVIIDRIPDHYELANESNNESNFINKLKEALGLGDYYTCWKLKTYAWYIVNLIRQEFGKSQCKAFILYDSFETHFMLTPFVRWFPENWDKGPWYNRYIFWPTPAIPTFTLNYTVGNFLVNNSDTTTLTGYGDQEFKEETTEEPGITAYNVVGNIIIDNSPEDAVAIISNRIDGWWGQTPGDSGIGGAILLGIAKYLKDYNIKPKYNLTFLFTTGEEYNFRGAYYYNDSHKEPGYNMKYWLGLDQLCFDQSDAVLGVYFKNESHSAIIENISSMTGYTERTGYDLENVHGDGGGSEQFVYSTRENCDTFMIVKGINDVWDRWHRTGMNYTEGDSLKYTDRNDVNVTAELAWNITKYFCVDPDCWFDDCYISLSDSDDEDNLVDTISFGFNVTSTLPHDLAMVNCSLTRAGTSPPETVAVNTINFTVNRSKISKIVSITLPEGKAPGSFYFTNELYNSTGRINEIINLEGDNTNFSATSGPIYLHPYNYGVITPNITNITDSPNPVGYGFNVTINADVTSNVSAIDMVTVNISYPDDTMHCFNMSNTTGDTYEYIFCDTWQYGQYDYIIWARDINGNETGSLPHSFNVTINATISICTIKDSYGDNETINITDPPSDPSMIGYELLDNSKVLHVWNKYDDYYFNTSNGIQFTNHYNEYWSHNVLKLGYYNNDQWNLIYRTDELSGFNKNIDTDYKTYVNATLWKDLSYMGYEFRLAVRYYLGVDDNELTIIPYIKNIDNQNIPYVLGFAWEINNISIDMASDGDYIEINNSVYELDETLDLSFTNMTLPVYCWDNATNETYVCDYTAVPYFYIREDMSENIGESLYLRWNESLDYKVTVKSVEGEYNAPVTLGIKIGTLNQGQEKQTSIYWHDASEISYYFDAYNAGETWASNPGFMIDGITSNYASTTVSNDVELCDNNTCNGSYLGIISKVEIRGFGYWSNDLRDIILRPVFKDGDGNNHVFTPPRDNGDWSQWYDITGDNNAPSPWVWNAVKNLDCDIQSAGMFGTVYCSKVELRVTYTPNNYPWPFDSYPVNGSIGICLQPMLNISVIDTDGDSMNISWLSNSSGSWQVFGTNNSVGNGTYHQIFGNASVNGQWWYWRVNVSDGTNYTLSDVYRFYTGYESKVVNLGSTHFKGYLLMQVEYYNTSSSSWVVVDDTVNESSPRIFKWDSPGGSPGEHILGLDTVFNGLVNTNDLSDYGSGSYRVYVCVCDPFGNVLNAGTGSGPFGSGANYLEASYEFTITFD